MKILLIFLNLKKTKSFINPKDGKQYKYKIFYETGHLSEEGVMYWKDYINTYNEKKGEKPFSITDGERYVKLSKCWYDNGQLEKDHSPTRALG